MKKVLVIAIALTFVFTAVAFAGGNPLTKLAVHVKATGTTCKSVPQFATCSGIVFDYEGGGDIHVVPVFFDMTEFTVIEFGLTWPAEWLTMSWFRCKGSLAIGTITNPGDGTAISYGLCQSLTNTACGYGWLIPTGPGLIVPVPNPATGQMGVVDCAPSPGPYYDVPMCVSAGGYMMPGDDPCRPTATEESTWGSIKSMFE